MNFIPLYTNFLGDSSQSHRFTQHIKSNNFKIISSNLTSFVDFILSYSTLCLIAQMFTKHLQQCAQKRILLSTPYTQSFCNISVNERFVLLDSWVKTLASSLPLFLLSLKYQNHYQIQLLYLSMESQNPIIYSFFHYYCPCSRHYQFASRGSPSLLSFFSYYLFSMQQSKKYPQHR